jgi:hypothetical protein
MVLKNHFVYMLAALLIFLVAAPIASDYALLSDAVLRAISYSCLLVVGLWSLRESNRVFRIGLAIVAVGLVLNILAVSPAEGDYVRSSRISILLFLMLAVWASFRQVLFSNEISFNRVVGAICVYLLLGSIWAVIYAMIEQISPGSFSGSGLVSGAYEDVRWVYFSFITLTTLGYGDITPVTNTARVLVYAEAVVGVFYMAVMVAGLVSGYISGGMVKK